MLCPSWRKNVGRTSADHGQQRNQNGVRRNIPTVVKEETKATSIEDVETSRGAGTENGQHMCRGSCEITLQRKPGETLGVGIAGGIDGGCPPTISYLRQGGIAHRSDRLQVGDLLLGVNGINVTSMRHENILSVLRNAGESVILSIEYDLNHPCFKRAPVSTAYTKSSVIRLEKENAGLGITIRGGAYGPDASKSRPLTVTTIRPGSSAHRDGRIRNGDRVTSINGVDVSTATLQSALVQIDRSDVCVLTIDYDVSILEAVKNAQGPLLLEIDKPAAEELGVTLNVEESIDQNDHLISDVATTRSYVIGAIASASVADRCGALCIGDQILSVDGVTLKYTTLAEVYQLLKGGSNSVNICVEILPHYLRGYNRQSLTSSEYAVIIGNGIGRKSTVKANQIGLGHSNGKPGDLCMIDSERNGLVNAISTPSTPTTTASTTLGLSQNKTFRRHASLPTSNTGSCTCGEKNNKKTANGGLTMSDAVSVVNNNNTINSNCHNGLSSSGRGRKLAKQQHISAPHLCKSNGLRKIDERRATINAATAAVRSANGGGGARRSASVMVSRNHVVSSQDFATLSSGSLTASVTTVPCGQVCHSEVMEVTLNCWARGGYGLILHRNHSVSEQRSPLFISYIERGSPADKAGVLQVGDRVLAIKDRYTINGTPEEANYIIRHSTGPLSLTIEFDVIESVLSSSGVFTVKLAKRGQNLGIVIATTSSTQKGDPVIVSDVITGSVAHRCGTVHIGDQILAIDNIPLDTCTVDEAARLLQRSSDIVKLRIKKHNGAFADEIDSGPPLAPQTVVYTVEMSRKNCPLGLTIEGSHDRYDPIFISQLAPGGLAERTGAVRVGDRILAINGQSLKGKRVSEALQLLHQAGDTTSLKIVRCFAPMMPLTDHSRNLLNLTSPNNNNTFVALPGSSGAGGGNAVYDRTSIFHDHFADRDTSDKLGTPVQSIDSAVESLEDSPLNDSHHPSTVSNRTSQNSKSSSLSGAPHSDAGSYADDLTTQLERTLSGIKNATANNSQGSRQSDAGSSSVSNAATDDEHYAQLGGEGCPCQTHATTSNQSQEEWIRVLDALETVGEAEMLRKLEESILNGSVPPCGTNSNAGANECLSGVGVGGGAAGPKPPPKPVLSPPFPLSNTILRRPYPSSNRLMSSSYNSLASQGARLVTTNAGNGGGGGVGGVGVGGGCQPSTGTLGRDAVAVAASILSPNMSSSFASLAPSAICATSKPLSVSTILSGSEHIPFITTPVPSSADLQSLPMTIAQRPQSPSTGSTTPLQDVTGGGVDLQLPGISGVGLTSSTSARGQPLTFGSAVPSVCMPVEVINVTLVKDKYQNDFGFSVSDGVQDKGVYINKIRAGGPADLFGGIRPYDRILQVNGTNLHDWDCTLAVPLLAAAGDKIDLLIYRDPVLAASYRGTDSIEEEDEDDAISIVNQTTV